MVYLASVIDGSQWLLYAAIAAGMILPVFCFWRVNLEPKDPPSSLAGEAAPPQPESGWIRFVKKFRIVSTRVVAGLFVTGLLFSHHAWPETGLMDTLCELAGVVFLLFAFFGRVWSGFYVSGYKTRCLVTEGPYSMTRNPLYFFSFLGVLGVGFATEMFTAVALIAAAFAFYYPSVISAEETKMRTTHGGLFEDYCRQVPRFVPRLSLLKEPETYVCNPRLFRKMCLDGMGFFGAYAVVQIIKLLQTYGLLPVYFFFY